MEVQIIIRTVKKKEQILPRIIFARQRLARRTEVVSLMRLAEFLTVTTITTFATMHTDTQKKISP